MPPIDLNCDMGEAFGNYPMPNDLVLLEHVTSVNIACGFHAGDPGVMQATVRAALERGVAIGAHPGLPDLQGFGRREMQISMREAYQVTLYQLGALYGFVRAAGGRLAHVKAHGALYNMAARDIELAKAIVEAVRDFDPGLLVYVLAGSKMVDAAAQAGMQSVSEVFADRTYQDDGALTPRTQPNAMIGNEEQAISHALRMATQHEVVSVNNRVISLKAETLCLHGDGEHAVDFAKTIRARLKSEGITVQAPLSR
ncbi:LamB/YcsF family protein [Hufsiella ginkgonis]|uniref:5-oxoprolinase subunit A n=1 Tax=Hufsiella ginkgonis TaxID=2695274 RepID=A0A7K1Y2Q8_9SPHI|nr:5-oxoprolinase subunit PxpA [Hufsiella ginkgonis]MXV17309.1 5-oxoprolinase subunit PxpA [Hufsiella ginkgonis]